MRYIMGVDGGGSKTYTVITDENGNKIGEGISGCGNYQMIGLEQALAHIKSSIDLALEGTGLTYKEIEFVQYGLAGADRKKDYSILRSGLKTLPLQNWDLLGDALVGLNSAVMIMWELSLFVEVGQMLSEKARTALWYKLVDLGICMVMRQVAIIWQSKLFG